MISILRGKYERVGKSMKKTVSLLLVVMMVLVAASALAFEWTGVGSHPSQGDLGGVRAAIITDSISPCGVVINHKAIDSLGLKFGLNTWSGTNYAFYIYYGDWYNNPPAT